QVRIIHASPAAKAPTIGASATPREPRSDTRKWIAVPIAAPTMRARRICTRGLSSGDEADATGLFGAEFDEGEARGRDDVGRALRIGEAYVRRTGVERGG